MPLFTIEATYRLPVYRHATYEAETPEAACRLAIEDGDWDDGKRDYESAGETYVTGIWSGADAAYRGESIVVPGHFDETTQRKADHFERLLGLLKIVVADLQATTPEWLARANWAIAVSEVILEGARGPDTDDNLPALPHVLAELYEPRVRDQIAGIVETDPEFADLAVEAVTDADIHAACIAVAAAVDLSEETGSAEYRAALAALRRHRPAGLPSTAKGA